MTGGDPRLHGPFFEGLEEAAKIAESTIAPPPKAGIKNVSTAAGDIRARDIAAAIRARMTSPPDFPSDPGGEDD